ncbi:MAG: class I SAM-dependent methyltransferase [Pirellulaceae bacterium]|nr:class I SAM-dependent methyltransferase [Pirellulaceae bacterium]
MNDSTRMRESDIRPPELMLKKKGCIDSDRRYLLERRDEWVVTSCPACESMDSSAFGEKDGFQYVQCTACKTVYTCPRPSESLLHKFYSQSANYAFWNEHIFPATEDVRRTQIFRPRADKLLELCDRYAQRTDTLLEIGAAFGTFCCEVRERKKFNRIVAVEPTPTLAMTCRGRKLEVIERFVEQIEECDFADVVAAFEVVEHLFAPRAFIKRCKKLLRPGGLLVVTCPNVMGFDVATLGVRSGTFDHEHLNYFHPASLALAARIEGLAVLEVLTPGQLDVDIVRRKCLTGDYDVTDQPFLRTVLLDQWEALGSVFQQFLADNQLSSHMWLVAQRNSL